MKKIFLTATCLLLVSSPAFAVKQTITSTDTGAQSRTKLDANFTELYDGKADKTAAVRYWSDWPTTGPNNVLAVNTIVAYGGSLYKVTQEITKTGSTADPETLTAYFSEVTGGSDYTLPTATDTVLGGVKVGARLSITDGVLSADVQTGEGSMVYPGAGIPNSTGSAWGTSYTVGTGANNLVQLNASSQLPAVSAALLTNFPTLNQNTTGTSAGLSGTPNITVGTISAGAAGFAVDADGDVTAKSVTITRTTSPTTIRFYEGTGGGNNYIDLTLSGNLSGDSAINLDTMFTSTQLTTPIIVDGSTLTFDESAADPNDADVALSVTDGVFKIAAVNGANNEDLTVDLDQTANTAILGSSTGLTLITTGSIPLNGAINVVGKSSDYTIGTDNTNEAYGSIFFNTAASTRTFTLPSAVAGMSVCIKNLQGVAQILRLDAATGDYIVKSTGARTSASGEYYGATADAKNQLCVVAYDSTDWYVTSEAGTWAEE